jgi:serine/threonine-protein kinase
MALSAAEQLDRYEVVEEIGRGAMGTVYLAEDPLIGRLVAIKSLNVAKGLDAGRLNELREASLIEAQAAGILSHPNIVTIHDVFEGEDGTLPLIAMEYVRGTNLKEVLKGGQPLPHDFVDSVVRQVASALDYAHERGVIHGDVKPANILITDTEQVKLTDFGIARLRRDEVSPGKKVLGTPRYIAPEQVLRQEVDHRADIFSLGVVVFEMLCGCPPYDGKTTVEIIQKVAHEDFELPRDPDNRPSPQVATVLDKALRKEPRERYRCAGDLAADLRRALSGDDPGNATAETQDLSADLPDQAVPKTSPMSRWVGQKPSVRRVATATLALLLAMVGWFAASLLVTLRLRDVELPVSAQEYRQLREAFPLLQKGVTLMSQGDPGAAAEILELAELAAPSSAAAARLRQGAVRQAEAMQARQNRDDELQNLLAGGRAALARNRRREAVQLAIQALELDPERPEAVQLLSRARAPQPRSRRAVAAAPPPTPTPAPTQPSAPEAAPQPDQNLPATLRLDFFSHLSKGVLTIYADRQQILLEPFRFVKRSSPLRRKGVSGRLERELELPAGTATLRIYVAAQGRATQTTTLPVRLQPGRVGVLRIAISESGETSVDLI